MQLTHAEASNIIHHLMTAADTYRDHAKVLRAIGDPCGFAPRFDEQAQQCIAFVERIEAE